MFTDFYTAYEWLEDHPIFKHPRYNVSHFAADLDISVVKVNPETEAIDEDNSLNTHVRVWLEHGPFDDADDYARCSHDYNLDSYGNTFEEAIMDLALKVHKYYGDYSKGSAMPDHYRGSDAEQFIKKLLGEE